MTPDCLEDWFLTGANGYKSETETEDDLDEIEDEVEPEEEDQSEE